MFFNEVGSKTLRVLFLFVVRYFHHLRYESFTNASFASEDSWPLYHTNGLGHFILILTSISCRRCKKPYVAFDEKMWRFPGKEILYGARASPKVTEIEGGAPQRHSLWTKSLHKTFFSLGGWDLGGFGSRRFEPWIFMVRCKMGCLQNGMSPRWLFSLREEG